MRTTTSFILGATLLATSVQAASTTFCQQYRFTGRDLCTKVQDGLFSCKEGADTTIVKQFPGGVIEITAPEATQNGVKLNCGPTSNKVIYFVNAGVSLNFTNPACDGPALVGVSSVQSAMSLTLSAGGQEFNFTDGAACTKEADGSFLCGDSSGATIRRNTSSGDPFVTMTTGEGDAAVKVSCGPGIDDSMIYFASGPGGSCDFMYPMCGGDFISAVSVKSSALIVRLG